MKKEIGACSVAFDLPADHELRQSMTLMKTRLEALLDRPLRCQMTLLVISPG